jgi:iron(III) transport system ATP-binding protein
MSAADRDVSMVFQSYALFPHMTVAENVAYGPTVSGVPKDRAREMAMESLGLVGLKGFEGRLASELSGGQQQRVAVARALVLEPKVLLFDEPLSNLDAKLRRRVREEIRELQRKLNLTVVYVTHDQQEALAVSDRVIVMSTGAIAQQGAPRELYENPAGLFIADFIGDANVVDAELSATEGPQGRVRIAGLDLRLPHRGVRQGAIKVAIRPESLLLHRDRSNGPAMAGRITKAAYLGTHMEYTVDSPLGELFVVDRQVTSPYPVGTDVAIGLAERGVTVIPPG